MRFVLLSLIVAFTSLLGEGSAAERPNVLWLTAEDMSPHLGCYGDADARTPRLDEFAKQAVRYTRAFATAPVCSPVRSCLITGMYATSLGTQRLRSAFPIPVEFAPFPKLLREAGYYCSNNVKTDYNVRDELSLVRAAWDDSSSTAHWRNRPKQTSDQPFFAVFNFMDTHQSRTSAWPQTQFEEEVASKLDSAQRHDPATLTLPPFYPDTFEARRAWARYQDCITVLDGRVGQVLDELNADGLANDTIVFFFSDHGMGMPRGKRCLYDSGLHVPLLVRFPEKWQHLAPGLAGSVCDRLVSFVDFAPTVLNLAGVLIPEHYQGTTFLGANSGEHRRYVYGARDRVDEAFDVARSVRNDRWLYIRNFFPHLPWMQPEGYSDTSTFRQELKRLASAGELGPGPLTFAAPRRKMEELYDTLADPHQLDNLADDLQLQDQLKRMREELRRWQLVSLDTGFLTEPQMWSRLSGAETPWSLARDPARYPLTELLAAANCVGMGDQSQRQRVWLFHKDDGVRYWAAVGLNAREDLSAEDRLTLQAKIHDASPDVRIECAAALAGHGEVEIAIPVLVAGLRDSTPEVSLHAARALELLGPAARAARPDMLAQLSLARVAEQSGSNIAMFIRFSLEAALSD